MLEKFYELAGFWLNVSKSELFVVGLSVDQQTELSELIGFRRGVLPVRYLGLPLVTRKLSEKDCVVLIEKIRAKLGQWSKRLLSYAGRLQLIRVVLFNMVNFWWR